MRNAVIFSALLLTGLAALPVRAADTDVLTKNGVLDRLVQQTGVYNKSKTGTAPGFVSDPTWPQVLPHSWLLGQVGGLYVDQHDHIWVYNRPRTMTTDESGLDGAVPGAKNNAGVPISGIGFPRPNGPIADCCRAAPSVLEFDADGKLLQAWGGPSDPGWMETHCKEADGCIWPNTEHGIYVDQNDNVWLGGNGGPARGAAAGRGARPGAPAEPPAPWTTNRSGGSDGFILKFDMKGNFKMRIGGTPQGPNSNDTNGGINGTPVLDLPADMMVDPKTNRLYVADGYGNRRVLIVDADTGKYIGHFGAYGNNPIDDAAAKAAGPWMNDYTKGNTKPAFFRNPVHCVKIANDGKIYVCDRGNDRMQVFDSKDPNLGKPCSNPNGEAGKCGFVTERLISEHTDTPPPGTAVSLNFSKDPGQSCLYVGDNSNMTVYILNRSNLQELGRFGRSGRMVGDFHWLHQVSVDSKGNIYTAEVDVGKRIQKFLHYGSNTCSGTGNPVIGGVVPENR